MNDGPIGRKFRARKEYEEIEKKGGSFQLVDASPDCDASDD